EMKPACNPRIVQILDVFNSDIRITSQNAIDSLSGYSGDSNITSSGKNICITGYMNGRVTYGSDSVVNDNYENKMYVLEYEIPFKAEIFMEDHYSEYIKVIPKVAFLDATLVDDSKVYINTILDIDLIHG
ncbi:MAG: hypothetical protein ACRC3Y_03260, partial [Romboutsia sp.]|uniref:hypothetical protein n=1 Tax=Romboutsia sp. TaxID=1965302 RepID=UPI003F392E0E